MSTYSYLQRIQLSTVFGLLLCLLIILLISSSLSCTYTSSICTDQRTPIEVALSHHKSILSQHDWISVNDEAQRIQMWKTLNCPTHGYWTFAH